MLVTASGLEEARKLARVLLSEHLAACVNLVEGVESHYWWEGRIEASKEVLLVIKTRAALVEDVVACVRREHSYSVPEVVALPIVSGNADYLRWLLVETGASRLT